MLLVNVVISDLLGTNSLKRELESGLDLRSARVHLCLRIVWSLGVNKRLSSGRELNSF